MRSHPHHSMPLCTRAHQIGALALIFVTFVLTRTLDRLTSFPNPDSGPYSSSHPGADLIRAGVLSWPDRGYGRSIDLRIYVYKEAEIEGLRELMRGRDGRITPQACVKGQWGTQVKIHRLLLKSKYRTMNKDEADFFFVPSYVKCVRMMGGLNDKEINKTYVKVLSQMPYFRRSGGRDHIFIFPSGAGAHLFRSWATYLNRSIILTPEGDRTDKRDTSAFNTWKDIIIPGNVEDGMTKFGGSHIVRPLPLSKRKYLANFLGRAQGKIGRLQLIELAKQYPDKLESPELKLSGPNKLGRTEYFDHLKNAKFCLAPRGESSWTLRFYESFFVLEQNQQMLLIRGKTKLPHIYQLIINQQIPKICDLLQVCFQCLLYDIIQSKPLFNAANNCMEQQECVPVILSDQVELPFQNVIDYAEISIKWPSSRISIDLLDYLQSIPDERIEEMIARGREVRCLWVYAPDTVPCSAMLGILWELQRKVRRFHQSTETFWLHNRSFVNRELVEFHSWRTPVPLP